MLVSKYLSADGFSKGPEKQTDWGIYTVVSMKYNLYIDNILIQRLSPQKYIHILPDILNI